MTNEVARLLLYLFAIWFVHPEPYSTETMEQFANKVAPVYATLGVPTNTSNVRVGTLPRNVYAGTWSTPGVRCGSSVVLGHKGIGEGGALWKYLLAHEWAHVAQGPYCFNNEVEATIIALAVLMESREYNALFHGIIWLGEQGELSTHKYEPLNVIMNDDDGVFQFRTGTLDARRLWMLMHNIIGGAYGDK